MAFIVNGIDCDHAYVNGVKVDTIYVNGIKVFSQVFTYTMVAGRYYNYNAPPIPTVDTRGYFLEQFYVPTPIPPPTRYGSLTNGGAYGDEVLLQIRSNDTYFYKFNIRFSGPVDFYSISMTGTFSTGTKTVTYLASAMINVGGTNEVWGINTEIDLLMDGNSYAIVVNKIAP